jgi:hypothetical protein
LKEIKMANEIETSFNTEAKVRISIDQYDGGVWLCLQGRRAMMSAVMTRAEAEQLLANLQLVLAKEVTA